MKRSEAIKNVLIHKTHSDLAGLYNENMEVQIMVAKDGGERAESDFKGRQMQAYTDGFTTWYPFRIPKGSNIEPEDNDININYDLAKHVEAIGCTGWDWKNRISKWVGFDFDAMVGHAESHTSKLSDTELHSIRATVENIPWVTVRRSTSGNGLHLYVFINDIPTITHTEHAALARSILALMSSTVGFDFQSKVDAMGHVLWIYHRKVEATNGLGLSLLKQGIILKDVPITWQDNISVISGKRGKTLPSKIKDADDFINLSEQQVFNTFDIEHKKLIDWLRENNHACDYIQDLHILVTHSASLKEAHKILGMRGIYDTIAIGREPGDWNVFLSPNRRGSWVVRRYTKGVAEAPNWYIDQAGWTTCYLNKGPDLKTTANVLGGMQHPKGGFLFISAKDAIKAANYLGVKIELPDWILNRSAKLIQKKDNNLVIEIEQDVQNDIMREGMKGWISERKLWSRVYTIRTDESVRREPIDIDDTVRHLVTPDGADAGWAIKVVNSWHTEPINHVRLAIKSLGHDAGTVEGLLGTSIFKCWKLVNKPFQPEYLGNREWNRNAAQLRFAPSPLNGQQLYYPTWLKLLNHIGQSLNDVLKDNEWAKNNNIITGADYLKCWIASLFQFPSRHLPYLFLYSHQEQTGKTTFHEAISRLITSGSVQADNALKSQSNFNAELENAVLCAIEETDLRKTDALNKMKAWVTSTKITIHPKGINPYDIVNCTHWIQTANDPNYFPVLPGDTRIVMLYVDDIDPSERVTPEMFTASLEKEAPDFLAEIMHLELPASGERLNVPVIATEEKYQAQQSNRTTLQIFLDEQVYNVQGEYILFSEFVERFWSSIDPSDIYEWSKIKIGRSLPPRYPHGRLALNGDGAGKIYIGNVSWLPGEDKIKLILKKDKLVPIK